MLTNLYLCRQLIVKNLRYSRRIGSIKGTGPSDWKYQHAITRQQPGVWQRRSVEIAIAIPYKFLAHFLGIFILLMEEFGNRLSTLHFLMSSIFVLCETAVPVCETAVPVCGTALAVKKWYDFLKSGTTFWKVVRLFGGNGYLAAVLAVAVIEMVINVRARGCVARECFSKNNLHLHQWCGKSL